MSPRFDLGPRTASRLSASRVDRAAERRADADAMRALESDSRARAYVIGGELIVLRKSEAPTDPLFTCAVGARLRGRSGNRFFGAGRWRATVCVSRSSPPPPRHSRTTAPSRSPICARSRCAA